MHYGCFPTLFVRGVFQLAGVAPTADDADGDACAAGECKADEGLASGVDADERHLG